MSPSPRSYQFWGVILGALFCLLAMGLLPPGGHSLLCPAHAAAPAGKTQLGRCPMHPQIIRETPGKCPICGMDLAPLPAQAAPSSPPAAPPPAAAPGEKKPLCWVSPIDPTYIKETPGKDPQGNDLAPVYPTPPGAKPGGPAVKPGPPAPAPKEEAKKQLWHCPMHPQVIKEGTGKCPICGMDLVPIPKEAAPPAPAAKKERKIKYWVSPMDPGYVSDKPGKAPCGMDLVPVYEDEPGAAAAPGAIAVEPNTLQSMGVRTGKAEVRALSRTIRANGVVNFDEHRLAVVTTKVTGWVDRLYVKVTGEPIRQGQPLISIYSPELVSSQQEYLMALKHLKTMAKGPYPELADSAKRLLEASRRRLEYWDIGEKQIESLEKTGQVEKNMILSSPVRGIVIKRMVTQGQMVQAGMPLLEVADLSKVWFDGDLYEYELPWVKVGQSAEVTLAYLPGETFHGKVQYIYPYLKGTTRTARVRLSFANPRLKLKPEMYGQVLIHAPLPKPVVAVPSEAVLDSGEKQIVFIALGQGRFEPREVKLGVEGDQGWREVISGLKGGEEVVTSAQFLLDSESRIREAVAKMLRKSAPAEAAPAPEQKPAAPGAHKH